MKIIFHKNMKGFIPNCPNGKYKTFNKILLKYLGKLQTKTSKYIYLKRKKENFKRKILIWISIALNYLKILKIGSYSIITDIFFF